MPDRYEAFHTEFSNLCAKLDAAKAHIVAAYRAMEANPTDQTIAAYEDALDRADAVRQAIGINNDAEMRQRDIDSGRIAA